jgi:hypothetical protein
MAVSATAAAGQGAGHADRDAYFGAVAEFFELPRSEVSILGEWRLPDEEIPVVLFMARRAGVSPEALVALRRSGKGWAELAQRYRLDAAQFHVPLPESAPSGVLEGAYRRFRSLAPARWGEISLGDGDIVGLVNLRLLSQTLGKAPQEILAGAGTGSWVEIYARLIGGSQP